MADGPYTYYVDSTGGLDANPGTQALPWQTITKVNATLALNQSVGFMRGRTFAGQLTPGANGITYGAYGTGTRPVISGAGQTQCIFASARSNLIVQDLRLTAGTTYGLAADAVNGLTITNCEVDHAGSSGIILGNGTQTVTIVNNLIHDNGGGGSGDRNGIGVGGGGAAPHDITIRGNDIYANNQDGIRVAMTSAFNTSSNITIENNTIRNSVAGSGVASDACANLTIIYNVITNNATGSGLYIVPSNLSSHIENVQAVIYHNTVSGNLWGILTTNGGGGTFNVNCRNNLFANNGTAGTSAEMGLTTLTTWVSDYNLVFHAAGGNFMYPASFGTWAAWKTAVTPNDANSKNSDPLLNPDYTLQAGSPALGGGVFIAGVSMTNPPNIGAKGLPIVPTPSPATVGAFQSFGLAAGAPLQLTAGGVYYLYILNTGPGNLYVSTGNTPAANATSMLIPPLKTVPLTTTGAPIWLAADQDGMVSIMAVPR